MPKSDQSQDIGLVDAGEGLGPSSKGYDLVLNETLYQLGDVTMSH